MEQSGDTQLPLLVRDFWATLYYLADKEKFFCFSLNELSIREALHDSDFINVYMECEDATGEGSDMDELMCVRASNPVTTQ